MSVKTVSKDELRQMEGSEGLIVQGCGGSLDEWVDGINDMLTEDGILLDGTRFHDCSTFEHDGVTCLLFPFKEDVKLDAGKLAMWRLKTHANFGGTWLSDYVPNRLGGFAAKDQPAEKAQKPDCPLIGQDGNIFNLWELPPALCVKTVSQIRQRKCVTASMSPATITRRWGSSESTSTSPLWMMCRMKVKISKKEWVCGYEVR